MILVSREKGQELFKDYIELFEKQQRQIQETCEKGLNKTPISPWSTHYADDLFEFCFISLEANVLFVSSLLSLTKANKDRELLLRSVMNLYCIEIVTIIPG